MTDTPDYAGLADECSSVAGHDDFEPLFFDNLADALRHAATLTAALAERTRERDAARAALGNLSGLGDLDVMALAKIVGDWKQRAEAAERERDIAKANAARKHSGCACTFDEEGAAILDWCAVHAETRQRAEAAEARIATLEAALRTIANMPRGDYVMQGPMLPASIARTALAQEATDD